MTNANDDERKETVADIEVGLDLEKGADVYVATDPDKGLTTEQVEAARAKYGVNEIPVPETPLYLIFLRQFTGFLPFLIEVAAIVALAEQENKENNKKTTKPGKSALPNNTKRNKTPT